MDQFQKIFLKKYPGITEFISKSFKVTNFAMLIYNKDLAVSPITTHLPLNKVTKSIKKDQIVKKHY